MMTDDEFARGIAATVAERALGIANRHVFPSIPEKRVDKDGSEQIDSDPDTQPTKMFWDAVTEDVAALLKGYVRSTKSVVRGFDTDDGKHAWPKIEWRTKLVKKSDTLEVRIKVGTTVRGCASMDVSLSFRATPPGKEATTKKRTPSKPAGREEKKKKRVRTK